MMYGVKMLKQRVAMACLLAVFSLAVVRAEEPAPAGNAAADLVPVLDIRVNKAEQSLKDLKAFLDNGAPIASAMVMGNVAPMLLHTSGVDGIDGTRPVHLLVYLPKKVFTSSLEEIQNLDAEPLMIQLLPLSDSKVWLDKLGEEVDEIVKDGEYQQFTPKNMPPVYMKVAGKFAVIAMEKAGVDVGVAAVDKIVADDAARKTNASFQLEFRPRDLFAATGLDKTENRKNTTAVVGEIVRELVKETAREAGMRNAAPKVTDADVEQIAAIVYAFGEQAESVQMNATFSKDAASVGYAVEAAKDSELAKIITGMKALDMASLRGLPGGAKVALFGGSLEPVMVQLFGKLVGKMPAEARQFVDPAMEMLKAAEGQAFVSYFGLDENGKFQGAGEVNFKAGVEPAKQLTALQDMMKKAAAAMKEKNKDMYSEYTFGEAKELDGWSYSNWTTEMKTDNQEMAAQLAMMTGMFMNNPQHTAVLVKGSQAIFASGATPESALAAAKGFADRKTSLGLKAEFQKWLETDAKDRNAACELLFDPYPLVKRGLSQFMPNPEVLKLAEQTVGTLNPVQAALYAKNNTASAEFRLEAEAVKQWMAFVMQMQMLMQGGGEPMPEPGVEPMPPGGDF